ncbi:MAG: glycosyltransferase [Dehalococcoidia bacterium]|nr:glycosyltransferase [Dehalococcoidia bacterium]
MRGIALDESISVIVPVYNGERFLQEALASALGQTRPPDEVIVVDDGSTDGSATIIQSLPVTYLRQENQGPSAARNLAIRHASGNLLAFLDQDDVLLPHKLEAQLQALREDPDAGYALCYLRYLYEDKGAPGWFHGKGPEQGEPGYPPSCWLIRRETWDRVGPFQADRRYTQDMDWLARANDLGVKVHMVPEALVLKRIHGDNLLGSVEAAKMEMLRTLRDSAARKRAAEQGGT